MNTFSLYTCGIHCECGQSLALYIACTALTHAVAAAPLLVAAASGTDEGLMACYAPYEPYTQMLVIVIVIVIAHLYSALGKC